MNDAPALAARKRLQAVLDDLNPASGKVEPEPPNAGKGKKKQKKKPVIAGQSLDYNDEKLGHGVHTTTTLRYSVREDTSIQSTIDNLKVNSYFV